MGQAAMNLVRGFKASGCVVCKRRYPEVDWGDLELDHIDSRDKRRYEGRRGDSPAIYITGVSVEEGLAELLLCQVLCTDCHRVKTRNGNGVVPDRQLALFSGNGGWTYRR